jgi:hypothetical protein
MDVTNVIESKSEGFTYFSKAHCGNRTPAHELGHYNVHMSKLRCVAESRPPFWKCAPLLLGFICLGFICCKAIADLTDLNLCRSRGVGGDITSTPSEWERAYTLLQQVGIISLSLLRNKAHFKRRSTVQFLKNQFGLI